MKGVILAGGRGTRLSPLTDITNKFLLPVYDKLMIEYSILSLVKAGIKDIAIVLGVKSAGETINYLKSGSKYGCKFTYYYQDEPKGVPHALYQAKDFVGDNNVIVLCADNIIYDSLSYFINLYESSSSKALITTKRFFDKETLKKFAVLVKDENGKVKGIVEKPQNPPSSFAFCGVQIYDKTVWNKIDKLKLSDRGEYEITHVISNYIEEGNIIFPQLLKPWFDCGDKESLFEAQEYAYLKSIEEEIK